MSAPAGANDVVYVASKDHNFYTFKAGECGQTTCEALWISTTGDKISASPVVADDFVYIVSWDHNLYVYHL